MQAFPKSAKSATPLFTKDFLLVVVGQIISLFGNAILRFALPLYLLRETGSSALFGTVSACSFLPVIVFSLAGGVLADRVNKRDIMVALDFFTAFLGMAFFLLLGKVSVVPLMISGLMLLYGVSGVYQPAVQASIPALVARDRLVSGNAVINMVGTLAGLLGPVLGGVLYGAWGLEPILLVSAACFLLSAVMEIFIRIPHVPQARRAGLWRSLVGDLGEGWHFMRREKPVFLKVVAVLALFNLVLSSAMIVGIPVMVVNLLGMSDANLGFAQGAMGLGGLLGGLLAGTAAGKLKVRQGFCLLIVCALAALGMGIALLPGMPVHRSYLLIVSMSFLAMAASTLFTVQMTSIVQRQTPARLVGKIMAVILAVAMCFQPLGQALYGLLLDRFAPSAWLVMLAAGGVAIGISVYSKDVFLRLERGEKERE